MKAGETIHSNRKCENFIISNAYALFLTGQSRHNYC